VALFMNLEKWMFWLKAAPRPPPLGLPPKEGLPPPNLGLFAPKDGLFERNGPLVLLYGLLP
jgi:hypothetical protein